MAFCSLKSLGSCSADLTARKDLQGDAAALIRARSGVQRVDFVCSNHFKTYLELFPFQQKHCCDPFNFHKSKIKTNLKVIEMTFVENYGDRVRLIPGKKLCSNCVKRIQANAGPSREASPSRTEQEAEKDEVEEDSVQQVQVTAGTEGFSQQSTVRVLMTSSQPHLTSLFSS